MKIGLQGLRIFIFLSILTGVVYPWIVTNSSRIHFRGKAEGELIVKGSRVIGSKWIGQSFEQDKYFWPRPSVVEYNPLPSGGSNLSPTSASLQTSVQERMKKFGPKAPSDLLFSSASGLDPHISLEAALFQVDRVAKARKLPPDRVKRLVLSHLEPRQFKILGQPRVNVLSLNMSLDGP